MQARPARWGRSLARQPLAVAGLAYLVVLILAGLLAPALAPHSPDQQDLLHTLQGPSGAHLLGTDPLGRDVLSRLLFGITPSLVNAAVAVVVFLSLGVPAGLASGYVGGVLDAVVSRVVELMLSIPPVILVLVVLAVFSSTPTASMITLGVLGAPGLIRVVRGSALAVREELFVTAAQVAGVRPLRIIGTHVLRRSLGPIIAQATVFAGIGLAFQAALAFLGLLGGSGSPTWGGMIGEASQVMSQSSWLLFPPGMLLAVTVLALGVVGDAARDLAAGETPAAPAPIRPVLDAPARNATSGATRVDALLEVRQLQIRAGAVPLVSDASFTVSAGEAVALVGESGCGKTMTALAVLGLLPDGVHVGSGHVLYGGDDLLSDKDRRAKSRGSGLAYVPQDALGSLDPTHTVGSQLREVIRRHDRLPKAAVRARAIELLRQVHLDQPDRVLAAYPHEISGGMAQRINIAIALAGRPNILVADEPTTALDVTVQADILRLLAELKDRHGLALLLITHDWGVVADIADRTVVMYAGEVVEEAAADEVFRAPRFPYTAALLAADPSVAELGARLPTVPGRVPAPGSWPVGCRFASRCAFSREVCTSGELPLLPSPTGSRTRCIRAQDLVEQGALPR
jgi:peptide/nickel transport system permease protein